MKKVALIALLTVVLALLGDCAVDVLYYGHGFGLVGLICGIVFGMVAFCILEDEFEPGFAEAVGIFVFIAVTLVGSSVYVSMGGHWVIDSSSTAQGWKVALPGFQTIRYVWSARHGSFNQDTPAARIAIGYVLEMEPGTEVSVAGAMRNARDGSSQQWLFDRGDEIMQEEACVDVDFHDPSGVHLVLRRTYQERLHQLGLRLKGDVSYTVH